MKKSVFVASDHAGFSLKKTIQEKIPEVQWIDLGPQDAQQVDYPDFARSVAERVASGEAHLGLLLCGSGIGMSIAANKVPGIRAAVVENPVAARLAREHNDANVLCLGSRFIAPEYGAEIVKAWIESSFSNGERHQRRLEKIAGFENPLSISDPAIAEAIRKEKARQEDGLELIASENYVSQAVLEAQGSILTNKYAEGYPSKRYYGGCEFVDQVETLAIERACQLFQAEAANVQPHSGSQANMATYLALMNPGDSLLGMSLAQGGHLTHGSPANFSGKLFKALSYGLHPETHRLDYDLVREHVRKEKPKILIAGASAYPRVIDFQLLGEIAAENGIPFVVDIAHIAGLVATGLHPSPIPYATYTTTTTHKTLRGPRGGLILCSREKLKAVNSMIFPGIQGGPLMHAIAAKAVAFGEALRPEFKQYQERILENARALAESLMAQGFKLVTGGTENHLMLVDLTAFGDGGITGKEAESWLDRAAITVNKNTIPNEKRSPFITSGIRIGVPAVTTRGMKKDEMKQIALWIRKALESKGDDAALKKIQSQVRELCRQFPLYEMSVLRHA